MTVSVSSHLRLPDGTFKPVANATRVEDCDYVKGAIRLVVDGTELFSLDLWDDINWLWPFVINAMEDCRNSGSGQRYFPSQPLLFEATSLGSGDQVRLSVSGGEILRSVVVGGSDIYAAVAHAALDFFSSLERLCPAAWAAHRRNAEAVESWLVTLSPGRSRPQVNMDSAIHRLLLSTDQSTAMSAEQSKDASERIGRVVEMVAKEAGIVLERRQHDSSEVHTTLEDSTMGITVAFSSWGDLAAARASGQSSTLVDEAVRVVLTALASEQFVAVSAASLATAPYDGAAYPLNGPDSPGSWWNRFFDDSDAGARRS